ncbi:lysine--tRNA ligase [Candidatus Microgenomates bacterium]|nr:lysine--tRNA ligase [Candidatus Microgenomates bacterium]
MFWADEVAKELKGKSQHVTDGKTPSGRIHVGSLRGVIIHDAIVRALTNNKTEVKFSYIFDDFDAFDRVPTGLDKEKYDKYIGIPLGSVPSPDSSAENYGQFFAKEFENVFRSLGVKPEIIWQTKLHKSGVLDEAIKIALDNAEKIQDIYKEVSGSKKREQRWLPFQPICQKCGKIGTTKAIEWDGKEIKYECLENLVSWAKGCGYKGKISPFGGNGKLPWKIYWPARWFALGTTIEGEGKDLASKGGARDVANHIAKDVYEIEPPSDIQYEHFLLGGAKMSTSKGVGISASEIVKILPPEAVRFLMLRHHPMHAINFDPYEPTTIPHLFDEYDKFAESDDSDMARIFELSQIDKMSKRQKLVRFSDIVNLLQMPGKEKELEREDVKPRVSYAKIWLDRFAPEEEKFTVKEELPLQALHLSALQKTFLIKVADELIKNWQAEDLQTNLYNWAKEIEISSKEAFSAIYLSLIGKDHGPKAAWLILSLDKKFVIDRFKEAAG